MSKNIVYVGDIGTQFLVDTASNLTGATKVSLMVSKPGVDDEQEWVGAIHTETLQEYVDGDTKATIGDDEFSGMDPGDNVSRRIVYYTQAGNLDIAKKYKIQAYIESPSWTGRGQTFEQEVTAHYKP